MKKLFLAGLTLFSLQAFSQSYMVLNNGVTLTTDKAGFLYDFDQFIMPYKVTIAGGKFLVADEKLITVNEQGFLFRTEEKIKKIKGKGSNYFLNDDSDLVVITSTGTFFKYDKDSSFKKIKTFGGNFYTTNTDEKKKIVDLYTVNTKGNYFKMTTAGLNPADITIAGGSYFMAKGMIYTVSADGLVYPKPEKKVSGINSLGGNFFIDSGNFLFTVSEEGFLMIPVLPPKMIIKNIVKVGSNYLIDSEGNFFVVDNKGAVSQRESKEHDLGSAKVISL